MRRSGLEGFDVFCPIQIASFVVAVRAKQDSFAFVAAPFPGLAHKLQKSGGEVECDDCKLGEGLGELSENDWTLLW